MDALTFTDTRANLKDVMDRVVNDHAPVLVTRQKSDAVVMVSLADWNAMQETMHLVSSRANAARLMESLTEMNAGGAAEHGLIEP